MRKVKLQVTPLTDSTFERQGWSKHLSEDYDGLGNFVENREDIDSDEEIEEAYFWTLPIPKERTDKYAPRFVTNSSDANEELIQIDHVLYFQVFVIGFHLPKILSCYFEH